MKLRPYQREAVAAADLCLDEHGSALLHMATGTGKTVIFSKLIERRLALDEGRVMVLAHRTELLEQARHRLVADTGLHFMDVGIEQADRRASPANRVVVASVQTMINRLKEFRADEFGLIIVDEAHHAPAKSYGKILKHFEKAQRLGVTATPDRLDGRGLQRWFHKEPAYTYEIRDAIDDGYLVPIRAKMVWVDSVDLSEVRTTAGDLNEADLERVLMTEENLHAMAKPLMELAGERPTLVFANGVGHAYALQSVLNGYRAGCSQAVDGTTPAEARQRVLDDYRSGRFQFLVNCALFTEGVDLPLVSCIGMARPTESRALYCLDHRTEVLTNVGWLTDGCREWAECGTKVAAWCADGSIEWQAPRAVARREKYERETLVGINSPHLDIRVTDSHDLVLATRHGRKHAWGTWKKVRARNAPANFKIPVAGRQSAPGMQYADAEISFAGLVMSDGNINDANNQITLYQSEKYPETVRFVERTLRDCGLRFGHYTRDDDTNFKRRHRLHVWTASYGEPRAASERHLRGWRHLEGILDRSKLPSVWQDCDRRQLAVLLRALWLGDGRKLADADYCPRTLTISISGNRRAFAEDLQSLCVRRGMRANLSCQRNTNGNHVYALHVSPDRDTWTISTGGTGDQRPLWRSRELPDYPETVWCVEVPSGAIVTRRNGKVAVVGNCQMVGRGTRLLGHSYDDSVAAGKPDLLVVDLVGNAGKHRLVCALDILDGSIEEETRKRAIKKALEDVVEVEGVLEEAEKEVVELRRKDLQVKADVKYRVVNAQNQFTILGVVPRRGRWGGAAQTAAQAGILKKAKIKGYENLDRGQASQVIDKIFERRRQGLCTLPQATTLVKYGLNPDMSFEDAMETINAIVENGWRLPPKLLAEKPHLAAPAAEEKAIA